MEIRQLPDASIELLRQIDRAELVDYAYRLNDGKLEHYAVEWDIPTFHQEGTGPHTVQAQINHWREMLAAGGVLLGAFEGDEFAGIAIVDPEFEAPMAWLAYMHVSRPFRRQGAGRLLWDAAERVARSHGATSLYVSAIPSGPAIDFYTRQGCVPAKEPHPRLYEEEPEDMHLIKHL